MGGKATTISLSGKRALARGLILLLATLLAAAVPAAGAAPPLLFGSPELAQSGLDDLPHLLALLTRHQRHDLLDLAIPADHTTIPEVGQWHAFLQRLEKLPAREQIAAVNKFTNEKKYILDISNYGQEDYWAIVKEFLHHNGDCEDFAITKYFSLRLLGFPAEELRIAIVQDNNLGIAHAVLAVYLGAEILILDNQSQEAIPHRQLIHYQPLYSLNEKHWWLHIPSLPAAPTAERGPRPAL